MGGFIVKIGIVMLLILVFFLTNLSLADQQMPLSIFSGQEIFSPSDWIKENEIKVYHDKVVLDVAGATWAKFTDTNSMDPFIDESANAIEIMPKDADAINVGDVISYKTSTGIIIIHRVIEKNKDAQGIYYLVKGDNNKLKDPFKIRFSDVKGVVVAVIY